MKFIHDVNAATLYPNFCTSYANKVVHKVTILNESLLVLIHIVNVN